MVKVCNFNILLRSIIVVDTVKQTTEFVLYK